ncbi:hypothetical protein D3C78_1722770 [compost metagenome]
MGKHKTIQVLTKVFHHVITLGFAVHQHVQTQTFLLNNRLLDVLGDTGAVIISVEIAFFEVQTQAADFGGLRE